MSSHRSLTAAAAVLFLAAPLAAQGVRPDTAVRDTAVVMPSVPAAAPTVVTGAPSLGPKQASVTAGVRSLANAPVPLAPPHPASSTRGSAMMVVGAAALMVGAVVGGAPGEVVMVVGGTIGLVGLWNYLNGAP